MGQSWEMQPKRAITKPYSQHANGRAVLRSSLREFVCCGSCFMTGSQAEPGAITTLMAPGFPRFGDQELPRRTPGCCVTQADPGFCHGHLLPVYRGPDRDRCLAPVRGDSSYLRPHPALDTAGSNVASTLLSGALEGSAFDR